MRCWRLSASDCATDTLSTNPTKEISKAGSHNCPMADTYRWGKPNVGRPWGTTPTMLTPAVSSHRHNATNAVDTMTASMGASLEAMSANCVLTPARTSNGARYLRANTKKSTLPAPMPKVTPLVWGMACTN
ncbi:hypothetical protein D3C71_1528800 [compost metagenome]